MSTSLGHQKPRIRSSQTTPADLGPYSVSHSIPPSSPLSQPLTLLPDHILRLTFDLPSPSSTPPKFIHIEFEDLETGESVTYEAPGGGKGKGKDKDKGRVDLVSALRYVSGTFVEGLGQLNRGCAR